MAPKGSRDRPRKHPGGGSSGSGTGRSGSGTQDARFSALQNDPRFARPRAADRRIRLDDRFKGALQDKEFKSTARVDRYGRKLHTDKDADRIRQLYALEDGGSDDDSDDQDDDSAAPRDKKEGKPVVDRARGEGVSSSSEDEDDDDAAAEDDDDDDDEDEAVLPRDAPVDARDLADPDPDRENIPRGDVTRRFALVNLDWDHLDARDLFVAMDSFTPATGRVLSVKIYPSDFGRQRMADEDVQGPPKAIFAGATGAKLGECVDEDDEDDEDAAVNAASIIKESLGEEFDMNKLREYQLERLRYYYAIVECDSAVTARHIYDACDGAEYEASANFFDLRFVPDAEAFDDDEARDTCTAPPEAYEPAEFVTDALQHSKVKLTWDGEDPRRAQFAKKAFSRAEIDDMELRAYLASSDSEDEAAADKTDRRAKWRSLLDAGNESDGEEKGDADGAAEPVFARRDKPSGNMQVTFAPGLSDKSKDKKKSKKHDDDATAEGEVEETTLEKYQRKSRERRDRKKDRKGLAEDQEAAQVDLGFNDPFFDDAPASKRKQEDDRRKEKRKQREAEEKDKAQQRAELELLASDDEDGAAGRARDHFDMKSILRAEKAESRKGKVKGRNAKKQLDRARGAEGLQDDFEIDTSDPRFSAAFDSANHHFAIDPTSSRYVKTKAMDKVLARRRQTAAARTAVDEDDFFEAEPAPKQRKKQRRTRESDTT